MKKIAILYQASPAPAIDGIIKPMKLGGYSDSGADIAYSLFQHQFNLATPQPTPSLSVDKDWVFPDSEAGINLALEQKAQVLWLNTVLYKNHPICKYANLGLEIIGQDVDLVAVYDDKWLMRNLLIHHLIPVPQAKIIKESDIGLDSNNYSFPLVLKPLRGRGSQGVVMVNDLEELKIETTNMFKSGVYGNKIYIENFLVGAEITLTVMPPGLYKLNNQQVIKENHWCLPPVKRFNHIKGIAPYSGNIAVIKNSQVLSKEELFDDHLQTVISQCAEVAKLLKARAPIRIDCRANEKGKYFLFDVNLKPNLTGASRPHRKNQDSLTTIAAAAIGWSYQDLIANIFAQKWEL